METETTESVNLPLAEAQGQRQGDMVPSSDNPILAALSKIDAFLRFLTKATGKTSVPFMMLAKILPKIHADATADSNLTDNPVNEDISADAVMASACLPELFHAVTIDGESYWDGGYVANPALEPLINETDANDLLLVQLNPPRRARSPNTSKEIAHRLNEITFNANLTQAIHLIGLLKTALGEEPLSGELKNPLFRRLHQLRLHRIAADEEVFDLGHSTKLDPRWTRLRELHDYGAQAADDWLNAQAHCLGARSSIDCALL